MMQSEAAGQNHVLTTTVVGRKSRVNSVDLRPKKLEGVASSTGRDLGVSVSRRWAIAEPPSRHFRVSRIALFALVVVKVTPTTAVRPVRAAASAPATLLCHCGSDADAARTDTKVLWVFGMKLPVDS